MPLAPDQRLPVSGGSTEKKVARTWNDFGNLLQSLSGAYEIETASAVAILCVESSGKGFTRSNHNRMVIRFENHKLWTYWGKDNTPTFHRHFKYGRREDGRLKVWLGHQWRTGIVGQWQSFHGSQPKEWNVLEFARSLDDTAALYEAADLFVSAARHEPLGNVIIEAWSHRLPVVAARAAGAEELIVDGQSGILTPLEDAGALAAGIRKVLSDDTLRIALAAQARKAFETTYTEAAVVARYHALFETLVE